MSVPHPLTLPDGMNFGEATGVSVNSQGHVFVFSRGGNTGGSAFAASEAQLLEFGADGRFLREIGRGLYAWSFAHAVRVDPQDNIWATDKGSDTIVKFTPDGRVSMVFGRKQEAADPGGPDHKGEPYKPAVDGRFRQPTNVAWDAQGDTYISDGYVNARVAKVDRNGDWLTSWGSHGSAPGQFNNPHDIAIDAQGQVYVADRGNRRIQVFDGKGRFVRQFTIDVPPPPNAKPAIGPADTDDSAAKTFQPGAPWAICISPSQTLYVADAFPGRIYRLKLDGAVTGVLGGAGKTLGKFGWIHEMACPTDTTLWVAEILNWRVQKLLLNGPT
ncbi:peptidyl-alpha-hydroxyglycine alpha-amidating lyase family protein [Caulobacter sp. S45]|uniref:peptidyl-alpha-hydroxyglycine alpha-amidating lyase family protein n=1 Tax=Caulobacter sp. S45 TaxID=1641861 RepID=UPI001C20A8E4|nr:peptidyl-alpha-hydroxyglycine alpha-amidating lyase family protein [Caulobacter sp. S45]